MIDYVKEFKVVALRDCVAPDRLVDTPERAVAYWQENIAQDDRFNPDCECCIALLVNTRRNIKGHVLVSIGTLDTMLVHPREVFRAAIVSASAAVILMHNHPSGDPCPSEADIKVTRDLIRAGQLLKIELLDHIVVGRATPERSKGYASLRELGYFYS